MAAKKKIQGRHPGLSQWRRDFKGTALKFQAIGFDDRCSRRWNDFERVDAGERSWLHRDRPGWWPL